MMKFIMNLIEPVIYHLNINNNLLERFLLQLVCHGNFLGRGDVGFVCIMKSNVVGLDCENKVGCMWPIYGHWRLR